MRLTAEETERVILIVEKFLEGSAAELRLFGSRVDDHKRGGDIDLLLIVNANTKQRLMENKHYLLSSLKDKLGDQKIDLKIAEALDFETDPFLAVIYSKSILLRSFLSNS